MIKCHTARVLMIEADFETTRHLIGLCVVSSLIFSFVDSHNNLSSNSSSQFVFILTLPLLISPFHVSLTSLHILHTVMQG